MRRKTSAIVQRRDGWYGVTFTAQRKKIIDLTLLVDKSLRELKESIGANGYGVSLENGSAYLLHLSFPFTERRKIRLVIASELEERLPVTMEDMSIGFVGAGKGKILAGAIPKSLMEESFPERRVRITTIQSLAALYALRWCDAIEGKDFVFVHLNGNAAVIMTFKDDSLFSLRQFLHSPKSTSLHDAFAQITEDPQFAPGSYVMVADGEEGPQIKEYLEKTFHIQVEVPSLNRALRGVGLPDWLWAGVGTALLSIEPRGQFDLTGTKRAHASLPMRAARYVSAGLAALSLIVCGLFYTDYYLKERVFQFLTSEPTRIYRLSFPKSPPVRDSARAFRDKIKALDAQPGAAGVFVNPLAIFDELSSKIAPDIDVKVSEFACDGKEFTVSGTTVSFASVEKIKAGVEQMKGVSDVEMQNVELAANKQVRFRLRGKL